MYFGVNDGAASTGDQNLRLGNPPAAWMATARFGLRPAPGGLALVQDFLNTGAQAQWRPDLLADRHRARSWSMGAARAWSRERSIQLRAPVLTDDDVAELRRTRDVVEVLLTHGASPATAVDLGEVAFSLSLLGELRCRPVGGGWRWWSAAVCGEVLASQESGTWRRLKQCADPMCRVLFYDRSWNNSGEVHGSACSQRGQGETDLGATR